ncbi:hypothetical protein T01_9521 [Trichinella spiralis]|uniref:Uncharacterized protein n=1 Tax=Trichinella spiralis TaxID=6334 RepID=A0A0V1B7Y3_TRISP|nr:hypothetical protein T01_9521 [Trichinella spiralis]
MADVVLFGHTSLEIIQLVGECCSCEAAGPRVSLVVRRHSAKLSFYSAIFNTLPVTGDIISHLASYMITRAGGKERESK